MKKKLTNNLGMKILSLVLATILWLVVVNIDNPVIQRQFSNIPVDIINESAITSKGKVYEVVEGKTVDITVKGKRSIVDALNKSDMKAEADLKNLIFTNAVPIIPFCIKSSSVDVVISGDVQTLKVSLEDIDTKQFKITIVPKGDPEMGYSVGIIQAKPNIIQVSGAKSQIAKIDQIRAEMDVSNGKEQLKATAVPKAYDAKGRLIDSEKLSFSTDTIALTADFLKTKNVKLVIEIEGKPMPGYEVLATEYEPKEILIAGDSGVLKKVNEIPIKIDITDATANVETEVNISEWIPENTKLAEESQTVVVNIQIEKTQLKTISFNTNDIELRNLPTGMRFSYNQAAEMSIGMVGLANKLRDVTVTELKPYIDLEDLGAGTHVVKIELNPIEGVTMQSSLFISITLTGGIEDSGDETEIPNIPNIPDIPDIPDDPNEDALPPADSEHNNGENPEEDAADNNGEDTTDITNDNTENDVP